MSASASALFLFCLCLCLRRLHSCSDFCSLCLYLRCPPQFGSVLSILCDNSCCDLVTLGWLLAFVLRLVLYGLYAYLRLVLYGSVFSRSRFSVARRANPPGAGLWAAQSASLPGSWIRFCVASHLNSTVQFIDTSWRSKIFLFGFSPCSAGSATTKHSVVNSTLAISSWRLLVVWDVLPSLVSR